MGKKNKLSAALANHQVRAVERKRKATIEAAEEEKAKKKPRLSDKGKSKAQEQPKKAWIPFRDSDRVLLVGEANFAFAVSLVSNHVQSAASQLIATTYDSLEICTTKYDDAQGNIDKLKEAGATVLFDVDAGQLSKVKALKGKVFDRIVFNYPHVGLGEKDQDRNIRLNQILCLRFLTSAAAFLCDGAVPLSNAKKQKDQDGELASDDDEPIVETERGSILMTLREAKPYSEWRVQSLAKKGSLYAEGLGLKEAPPEYLLVRSGQFDPAVYPGYAHRRTIGYQKGISFDDNEDTKYSAKARKRGLTEEVQAGTSKMWQFCLK